MLKMDVSASKPEHRQKKMTSQKIFPFIAGHLFQRPMGLLYFVRSPIIFIATLFFLTGCTARPSSTTLQDISLQSTALPTSRITQIPLISPTYDISPDIKTSQPADVKTMLYTHPEGLFSLQAPENWQVDQVSNTVSFSALQDDAIISITVVNTGYPLDNQAFMRFVETQESTKASELEGYIEIDRQVSPGDDSIAITKSFFIHNVIKKGASYYHRSGQVVCMADIQVDEVFYETYQNLFQDVYSSISLNEDAISKLPIYSFDQADMHSNGRFSILIPPYWSSSRTEENYAIVETFISPDEYAVIQTIIYDDGQPTSRTVASQLALALLRENYTKKITTFQDVIMGDGREKLTWSSSENGYQGITSVATRGTEVCILTIMWGNDPAQYYQTILESVYSSYTLEDLPK